MTLNLTRDQRPAPTNVGPNEQHLVKLPNGVTVAVRSMPHLQSASVAVFVRSGSRDEDARTNGLSHFLEHMSFKGSTTRSAQRINLEAESLGASVNAFTSKSETAYFMNGLGRHAGTALEMLADIVCNPVFPEHEIERERRVILQEATEYEEDPGFVSCDLLDVARYGDHPMGKPIIGTRENIERFTRQDLLDHVKSHYTGSKIVVSVAGNVDVDALISKAAQLFGHLPCGIRDQDAPPVHLGGEERLRARSMDGISQSMVNMAFPIASIADGYHYDGVIAAVVFGGGMSSPLMNEIREERGLAYQVGSSSDIGADYGSFMIEAITSPQMLVPFFEATRNLLRQHADDINAVHLRRARNQVSVHLANSLERPFSTVQRNADQIFALGRILGEEEAFARIHEVSAEDVRSVFERLTTFEPAVAVAGKTTRSLKRDTFPKGSFWA